MYISIYLSTKSIRPLQFSSIQFTIPPSIDPKIPPPQKKLILYLHTPITYIQYIHAHIHYFHRSIISMTGLSLSLSFSFPLLLLSFEGGGGGRLGDFFRARARSLSLVYSVNSSFHFTSSFFIFPSCLLAYLLNSFIILSPFFLISHSLFSFFDLTSTASLHIKSPPAYVQYLSTLGGEVR